jgi:conjugal transfer ATP-binding protein TraC
VLKMLGQGAARIFGEDPAQGFNTGSAEAFSNLSRVPRLFDVLPYESYDEADGLFFNRETTGFVLIGSPVVGASLADQEQLSDFFRQSENLPEGSSLQFLLYGSPKIDQKLNEWSIHRKEIMQQLTQQRVEFLTGKTFNTPDGHLIRDYRLIISFTYPELLTDHIERHKVVQIRDILKGFLQQIGLFTENLDANGLIREVGSILNFSEDTLYTSRTYDPLNSLNRQILNKETGWEIQKDQVLISNSGYAMKSYVPKEKPRYWALGNMDKFLGDILKPQLKISCPFLIHYGLYVMPRQSGEKSKAFSKRESLENTLKNRMTKWVPGVEEEHKEFTEVTAQLQLGERIIQAGLSCSIFCKQEKLQEMERQVASIWRHAGWVIQPATYDHFSMLMASMPMMWTLGKTRKMFGMKDEIVGAATVLESLGRIDKTITREAQNLLPILAEWTGQIAPGMPLVGRRGQFFFWNPFDGMFLPGRELASHTSNYNVCISGKSGSGKSFFCNEMIVNTLSVGGKAFVLDKGNSFKNMCHIMGGHHIDFSANTNHSLNPFTHIPEGEDKESIEVRSEQLNILVQVLKTMVMPNRDPDEVQTSYLEEAVSHVWEKSKSESNIDDIYKWLFNHEDSRAKDLSRMLMKFAGNGQYANFFNRPATVNLNHDFVVIETQNLMNHEDLRAVLVQMMIVQVCQRMVNSDRKCPFLVLIDEAWELIQGTASGKFISAFVRTARKYRASLTLATQNLSDYFREESPGATAAFENSDWKCIFKQESLNLVEKLGKTEEDHTIAKQIVGTLLPASTFSEMALFGQDVKGVVGRLFCDPFSQLLYSTKAQDFAEISKYRDSGLDVEEAINAVLLDRTRGIPSNVLNLSRAP